MRCHLLNSTSNSFTFLPVPWVLSCMVISFLLQWKNKYSHLLLCSVHVSFLLFFLPKQPTTWAPCIWISKITLRSWNRFKDGLKRILIKILLLIELLNSINYCGMTIKVLTRKLFWKIYLKAWKLKSDRKCLDLFLKIGKHFLKTIKAHYQLWLDDLSL